MATVLQLGGDWQRQPARRGASGYTLLLPAVILVREGEALGPVMSRVIPVLMRLVVGRAIGVFTAGNSPAQASIQAVIG